MRIPISTIGLLVALSACAEAPVPQPAAPPSAPAASSTGSPHAAVSIDVDGEVSRLRAALMREVPGVIVDSPERERGWIARARAAVAASAQTMDRPQLLVVVDRNPDVQQMRIVLRARMGHGTAWAARKCPPARWDGATIT